MKPLNVESVVTLAINGSTGSLTGKCSVCCSDALLQQSPVIATTWRDDHAVSIQCMESKLRSNSWHQSYLPSTGIAGCYTCVSQCFELILIKSTQVSINQRIEFITITILGINKGNNKSYLSGFMLNLRKRHISGLWK